MNTVPSLDEAVTLAAEVGAKLRRHKLTCATAESCTGGLIGHLITEVPGSSDYFAGGAIVYSYAAKETVIGVDHGTLLAEGAVSAPVAQQMAQGTRQVYGADVAVAVTGIAGPGGGLPGKPTGTVYLHVSAAGGYERGERHVWPSDRGGNKLLSAVRGLQMIDEYLHTLDAPAGA
jgi:PncC family amidohydrolase